MLFLWTCSPNSQVIVYAGAASPASSPHHPDAVRHSVPAGGDGGGAGGGHAGLRHRDHADPGGLCRQPGPGVPPHRLHAGAVHVHAQPGQGPGGEQPPQRHQLPQAAALTPRPQHQLLRFRLHAESPTNLR